jgi:hypothetical protein
MKKSVLLIVLLLPFVANAQIVINELLAKNVSWNMDEGFNYSNWVELYNPSATLSYNLANFYFTDDLSNPTKWKPASKVISAKSYALLYFERDEIAGHATFKLSPEGGVLYLLNAARSVVDSVVYPSQLRNISWCRKTDNGTPWGFNDAPTPGTTNSNGAYSSIRCKNPVFASPGGFYVDSKLLFLTSDIGDSIYYSTDGTEPTRKSTLYTQPFPITITIPVRAKAFCKGKLSSDIVTATYFINQRETHLPMVSVATNPSNLFDPKIGIYVNGDGTNGKLGNGASSPMNWNADWDRPVNYELYDTTHVARLNQELDIKILGGWTKANPLKSIAIMPKKKFGNNKLKYGVFDAIKPGIKYHDIQMRNSGNDFYYSMMRDAFMQSIVQRRLNLDYEAYEPAVIFINGVYYGIENLRERTNESFVYSNYGIDEDDIYEIEATNINVDTENDIATDTAFSAFSSYLKNNDVTSGAIYQRIGQLMDIDNFISYNVADIFFGNTDWPYNNCKMWRKKVNGTWRWFLTDTDFGFNLWDTSPQTHNTLTFALGENQAGNISGYSIQPEWSTIVLSKLMTNEQFKSKFIDKFAIHLSTTFATTRIDHIMDSLALKISNEIIYHKNKYGSNRTLAADVVNMKSFSAVRATNMLNMLSARLVGSAAIVNINLSSNLNNASYTLNDEPIPDANLTLRYFQNRNYSLKPNAVPGYTFKHWEKAVSAGMTTIIPMGSTWSYFDGSTIPAANWNTSAYSDASWKTGAAQLGYGGKGEVTTIGYGSDANNKYIASYYRKTINIENLAYHSNFVLNTFVDDGAIIYVNGQELGRSNMPTGTVSNLMVASSANNGVTAAFTVPISMLREGANLIAVEVHQYLANSSDVIFNLSLTSDLIASPAIITNPVVSGTLASAISLRAVYELDNTPVNATVVLNELVSSNNLVSDETGEKDDYIELYNYGNQDIDLAGWYLTDDSNDRTKATIPASTDGKTILPALGRLVFWADGQTTQGPLHLPFKLSKEGDTVILSRPGLKPITVDSVCYPALDQNLSYSRVPDGGPLWRIQAMTCNLTNSLGASLPQITSPVEIYPTLVTDWLTVKNANGEKLMLFDLTGKCVYQTVCTSDEQFIQGAFLKPGIYLLRIKNQIHKILKR